MDDLKTIETNGIIKIYETDKSEKVVQARELHEGLGVTSKFADWIKNRINECDALEGEDYILISKKLETSTGGTVRKEYILKLDTAKEMAMLERNEKGKEYRRYFIEVEKKYKQAIDTSSLSPELQMFNSIFKALAKTELDQKEVKQELQGIRDVITLDTRSWREDSRALVVKIAQALGGNEYIRTINTEIVELLNARFGVNLKQRLTNSRRRMADEGVCKSKRDKLNNLDIIASDKKLIEGYVIIVKEMAIRHGVA